MNLTAMLALAVLPAVGLGTVIALDVDEPGLDALLRAVSFSPWGAVMVYVFWSGKRALVESLNRWAEMCSELLQVMRAWVAAIDDLVAYLRARGGGTDDPYRKPAPRRPKTNPVNLPLTRGRDDD